MTHIIIKKKTETDISQPPHRPVCLKNYIELNQKKIVILTDFSVLSLPL